MVTDRTKLAAFTRVDQRQSQQSEMLQRCRFESDRGYYAGLPERQSGRAVNALRESAAGVQISHPAPLRRRPIW